MAFELFKRTDAEQAVQQPAVRHEDFRSFDLTIGLLRARLFGQQSFHQFSGFRAGLHCSVELRFTNRIEQTLEQGAGFQATAGEVVAS